MKKIEFSITTEMIDKAAAKHARTFYGEGDKRNVLSEVAEIAFFFGAIWTMRTLKGSEEIKDLPSKIKELVKEPYYSAVPTYTRNGEIITINNTKK